MELVIVGSVRCESIPVEIDTSATDPKAGGNSWGGRDRVRSLKGEAWA